MSPIKCPMAKNDPSSVVPIAPVASNPTGIDIAGFPKFTSKYLSGLEIVGDINAVDIPAHMRDNKIGIDAPNNVALRVRNSKDVDFLSPLVADVFLLVTSSFISS
mmetsp:Transcript_30870/g.45141  ORF Transcript_30870/g.45141 Transcript_30870/m.45141 type:complete len:105 (+) Transcript_30870:527-841(+)